MKRLTFFKVIEKEYEGEPYFVALYKDENGELYESCCGWGIREGYKLERFYPEIMVKEDGKYFCGKNGIIFIKAK